VNVALLVPLSNGMFNAWMLAPLTNHVVIFLNASPSTSVPSRLSVRLAVVEFAGLSVAFKIILVTLATVFCTVKQKVSEVPLLPDVSFAKYSQQTTLPPGAVIFLLVDAVNNAPEMLTGVSFTKLPETLVEKI